MDGTPSADWLTIPLAADQTAGTHPPAYMRRGGEVLIAGRVMRAEGGQYTSGQPWLLGTMPDGLRPDMHWFSIAAVERGAGVYMARIEVGPDGSLVAFIPPGATSTTDGLHWISLDSISYPLPQPAAA